MAVLPGKFSQSHQQIFLTMPGIKISSLSISNGFNEKLCEFLWGAICVKIEYNFYPNYFLP